LAPAIGAEADAAWVLVAVEVLDSVAEPFLRVGAWNSPQRVGNPPRPSAPLESIQDALLLVGPLGKLLDHLLLPP
jgi:hypothetical protein